MRESINERDGARGVWEDFVPLCEGFVGSDDGAFVFLVVAPVEEFEEQIGMTVGEREVSNSVDYQHVRRAIMSQPPSQGSIALACCEVPEQFSGDGMRGGLIIAQVARL